MKAKNEIPDYLKACTQAGLTWINQNNEHQYELTGLVGAEEVQNLTEPFELGLVLCDGEICAREQIKFIPKGDHYEFACAETASPEIPPLLDPPQGLRSQWIDEQLKKYEFIVLLYYRGLW